MEEFKGTKGTWEVSGLINRDGSKDNTIILTDKGAYTPNSIQKTYSSTQELEDNAKLIAAAPDLLEVLQNLVSECEDYNPEDWSSYEDMNRTLDQAQQVINKALK